MGKYSVYDCSIIELSKHHSDRKGNITVVQNKETVPFDVKRVYYLYDVPGGESRGSHAHRDLEQLIIAASGSFNVTLDDGKRIVRGAKVGRPRTKEPFDSYRRNSKNPRSNTSTGGEHQAALVVR